MRIILTIILLFNLFIQAQAQYTIDELSRIDFKKGIKKEIQ